MVILNANHVIYSVVTTKYYFPVGTASDCLSIGSQNQTINNLPCPLELRWFQAGNLKPHLDCVHSTEDFLEKVVWL